MPRIKLEFPNGAGDILSGALETEKPNCDWRIAASPSSDSCSRIWNATETPTASVSLGKRC